MANNVVREEVLYTYEAAVHRYERERHHEWLCRQRKLKAIRKQQQERRRYFRNQKLLGLAIAVLSFILLLLTCEAFTILGIIAGVSVMVTKKMVIYNEYYRRHGGQDQWMQ